jgi:hypothetical protein
MKMRRNGQNGTTSKEVRPRLVVTRMHRMPAALDERAADE